MKNRSILFVTLPQSYRPDNSGASVFGRAAILLFAISFCGCGPLGSSANQATIPPLEKEQQPDRTTTETESSTRASANSDSQKDSQPNEEKQMETATFGAGCFWCVEAVFQQLKGVQTVRSGYMGGQVPNPTYEQVCSGLTGHAEVIQIDFDPTLITFAELLEVFWSTHDPTTLNQQGADRGTQYRSAVFFHSDSQQAEAEKYKKQLNEADAFLNPIVTEIVPLEKMYVAEDYHQNYFNQNPNQPYCRAVIPPKLEKLRKVFGDKLK